MNANPQTAQAAGDGDAILWACDQRDARTLTPGLVNNGRNLRFTNGVAETRRGVAKMGWCNKTTRGSDRIESHGTPYGLGSFQDPDGVEWMLKAQDGYAWRSRPYNQAVSIPLPAGVRLLSRVKFVQAFDRVFAFRGRFLAPLVMSDLGTGFEDILPHWNVTSTYATDTEVAFGPFLGVESILRSGDTATVVTSTPHGYVTGADITIQGADQAGYNARFNITVTDTYTFKFAVYGQPVTPATGAITCSNMLQYWSALEPATGQDPDLYPQQWHRVYNILPNAHTALYINNRLLVPTAYEPATTDKYATFSGGNYRKTDYLVATSYLDYVHFDFNDEFRINQGSDDEIIDLARVPSEDSVVVWKGHSWGVLTQVRLDLTNIAFDLRSNVYGLSGPDAWALTGSNIVFLSNRRGIVSIRQSEQGKLIGADVPLSAPIQKTIDRVNWPLSSQARLSNWSNRLYVGLPLGDGAQAGDASNLILPGTTYDVSSGSSYRVVITGLVVGKPYAFTIGNASTLVSTAPGPAQLFTNDVTFTAVQPTYWLFWDGPMPPIPGVVCTATLSQVVRRGVNNAILVFDFVAASRQSDGQNQGWTPCDTGDTITPVEWVKVQLDGEERLFFMDKAGFVNLMEESETGDQMEDTTEATGLSFDEIDSYCLTRGYGASMKGFYKPNECAIALAGFNPSYSLNTLFDGVNEKTVIVADKTRNRARYFRPYGKADYDGINANDEADAPYREDYSIVLPAGGMALGAGVDFLQYQEWLASDGIQGRHGRSFQLELTNKQGRIRLLGLRIGATRSRDRQGVLA